MILGLVTFMVEFSGGQGATTADYQVRGIQRKQESKQMRILINVVKTDYKKENKNSSNQTLIKIICLYPLIRSTGASEIAPLLAVAIAP